MQNKCKAIMLIAVALGVLAAACGVKILPVGEPAAMTAERLNNLLTNQDVVVVDVRHDIQWNESPAKIPGAVRGDAKNVEWARRYDKDAFLVLYCA